MGTLDVRNEDVLDRSSDAEAHAGGSSRAHEGAASAIDAVTL